MNTNPEISPVPPTASRCAERTRDHLRVAARHLAEARAALDATPPRYPEALTETLLVSPAALLAFLTWRGSVETPEVGTLRDLSVRAVALASILDTPTRRTLVLADLAPAIMRARHLTIYDKEGVLAGWYAARNLYEVVRHELPEAFQE